jgi:hypothetical protein
VADILKAIAQIPWDDWRGRSNEGLVQLYRQRADAENVFDELKNQWGFAGFCAQKAAVKPGTGDVENDESEHPVISGFV